MALSANTTPNKLRVMDRLSIEKRSALMKRVRRSGTSLEIAIRRILTHAGYRYRTNLSSLPGTPDLAFTARKKAIFVHGCFWHGHGCRLSKTPKTRTEFWIKKIDANKARDLEKELALQSLGWTTLSVWQCEVDTVGVGDRMAAFLGPPRWTAVSQAGGAAPP